MNTSRSQDFGLATIGDSSAAGLALKKRDIDVVSSKKQEFDFQGQVSRMLDAARQQQKGKGSGIKIDEVGSGAGLLDLDSLLDPIEKLLRKAHIHIREEEYGKALHVLDRLLAQNPNHHEAIYLAAYCQAHKDEEEESATLAVRTLRPLQGASLESALSIRVETLLDTLRQRRFTPCLVRFFRDQDNPGRLIPFLRGEVELDIGWVLPYYLLAGELMVTGNFSEALSAADRGIQISRGEDRKLLIQVRDAASQRLTEQLLQPVRQLYRQGKFGPAYAAIGKIPSAHRQNRLCATFEAYLRELSGGATGFWNGLFTKPRTPAEVQPNGTPQDVSALGFFLVGSDLEYICERLANSKSVLQDFVDAEQRCIESVRYAPWFPFIHFIYGQCIYARLIEAAESENRPEIEVVESDLRTAKPHLEYAAKDPEIKGVPDFIRVIEEVLVQVEKTRTARAKLAEEAKQINGAIEEFKAIMDSASGGLKSSAQQKQVRERLEKLNARLPNLKHVAKSPEGKEALKRLTSAVTANLKYVREAEQIARHFTAFSQKMEYLKRNRISSYAQLSTAKSFFAQLLSDANSDRSRLQDGEARKALDQLISQIKEVIEMLNRN